MDKENALFGLFIVSSRHQYDDDDEGHGHGGHGPGVQCASQ